MDDWLDSVFEEPDFHQHLDHHQVINDVNDDVEAAEGIHSAEVLTRIKATILSFLEELFEHNSVPDISVGFVTSQHGSRMRRRSLLERQGQGAHAYARIFSILQVVHELLSLGMTASQRDIYYRLKVLEIFRSPEHVITAIKDVSAMLAVPRHALGVTCASRGAVFGELLIQEAAEGSWLDCSGRAQSIPGDCIAIGAFLFQSAARFLVIIEKDAIFQRLQEDGFAQQAQAILVTAKGMPDLATRAFLHALISALPHLRPVAVVDWNPSGAHIYSIYKYGSSVRQGSQQYAVPNLEWVAVRAGMLHGVPDQTLQGPLTARDKALIASLKAGFLTREADAIEDLDAMEELNAKAEIEALYELASGMGGFSRLLADDLLQLAAIEDAESAGLQFD